jgi:hypothetical protein
MIGQETRKTELFYKLLIFGALDLLAELVAVIHIMLLVFLRMKEAVYLIMNLPYEKCEKVTYKIVSVKGCYLVTYKNVTKTKMHGILYLTIVVVVVFINHTIQTVVNLVESYIFPVLCSLYVAKLIAS